MIEIVSLNKCKYHKTSFYLCEAMLWLQGEKQCCGPTKLHSWQVWGTGSKQLWAVTSSAGTDVTGRGYMLTALLIWNRIGVSQEAKMVEFGQRKGHKLPGSWQSPIIEVKCSCQRKLQSKLEMKENGWMWQKEREAQNNNEQTVN